MTPRQPGSAADYLGAFRRISSLLPGLHLDWLRQARAEAIGRFSQQGFPTLHDEEWKYTSVASIEKGRFNILPTASDNLLAPQVALHALPDSHLLVFVNGRLEIGRAHV